VSSTLVIICKDDSGRHRGTIIRVSQGKGEGKQIQLARSLATAVMKKGSLFRRYPRKREGKKRVDYLYTNIPCDTVGNYRLKGGK